MTKKRIIRLTVSLVAVLGGMVWMYATFSEPVYQGKTLRNWLQEADRNGDDASYLADTQPDTSSARAVRAIGADAIPVLVQMARTKNIRWKTTLYGFVIRHKWIPIQVPLHPDRWPQDLWMEAVYGFRILGPSAKSAVPDLVELLHDDDPGVRICAAFCLAKIGAPSASAVPALEKYLQFALRSKPGGEWFEDSIAAIYALGAIGPAAQPALSQIVAFTNMGTNMGLDMLAANSIAAQIKITGHGLAAAMEPLKDPSNVTNWYIARGVVQGLGSMATPAIPLLLENLKQTNEKIQIDAIFALGCVHTHPELCIPAIIPFLRSTNYIARFCSLEAISCFGNSARPWMPPSEMVHYLSDSNDLVRMNATNLLRQVAPEATRTAKPQPSASGL